jgi:hypothetical protein
MRKIGLVLAMISTLSMTVLPVVPTQAATPAPKATTQQQIAGYAARGDAYILSQGQMSQIATSNPALHAKLSKAYADNTIPKLTASEKRYVRSLTAQNLDEYKAGITTAGWIIIAAVIVVVALLLWQPIVCGVMPWMIGCAPVVAAPAPVRVRG